MSRECSSRRKSYLTVVYVPPVECLCVNGRHGHLLFQVTDMVLGMGQEVVVDESDRVGGYQGWQRGEADGGAGHDGGLQGRDVPEPHGDKSDVKK